MPTEAAWDLYASELGASKRLSEYGLPLYEPSPTEADDCVLIGDVGYVNRGKFHRLFNAYQDETERVINKDGVPKHFVKLENRGREPDKREPLPPGWIKSIHASIIEVDTGAEVTV